MLLVAGCAKDGPTNTSTPNKNETHTCQVPTVEITKVTAPKYFVPDAITPDGSLFGMSGSNLTLWNPKTDKLKIIGQAWSGKLSPDASKLAYIDEQGLHLLDLVTNSNVSIATNQAQVDSTQALGMWSPDSVKFMYMYVQEWLADYFVYSITTREKSAYHFKNIPKYLSRPVD